MDFTKTIIRLVLMASESIAHEAIDSEPIRARGIIVNYSFLPKELYKAFNYLKGLFIPPCWLSMSSLHLTLANVRNDDGDRPRKEKKYWNNLQPV